MRTITRQDLLNILYWGRKEISQFTGCSIPQATKQLTKARQLLIEAGLEHLYDNKVYNVYALKALGIDLADLKKLGILDVEVNGISQKEE